VLNSSGRKDYDFALDSKGSPTYDVHRLKTALGTSPVADAPFDPAALSPSGRKHRAFRWFGEHNTRSCGSELSPLLTQIASLRYATSHDRGRWSKFLGPIEKTTRSSFGSNKPGSAGEV